MITYQRALLKYVIGFLIAGALTLLAYGIVVSKVFDAQWLTALVIFLLAGLQLGVQMVFFLHLRSSDNPRWKTYSFAFAVLTVLIVVLGSLWIMTHLNYRMGMSGPAMDQYMTEQNREGF